jgi:hypothetical protein
VQVLCFYFKYIGLKCPYLPSPALLPFLSLTPLPGSSISLTNLRIRAHSPTPVSPSLLLCRKQHAHSIELSTRWLCRPTENDKIQLILGVQLPIHRGKQPRLRQTRWPEDCSLLFRDKISMTRILLTQIKRKMLISNPHIFCYLSCQNFTIARSNFFMPQQQILLCGTSIVFLFVFYSCTIMW